MVRSHRKVAVRTFMVGILLGISASVALAAYAESPWGYYGPFLGYSYKNKAIVSNDDRLYAATHVYNQASGTVPTGYMGALARLYKNDVLCTSTDWSYNSIPANGMGVPTSGSGCGSGIYYSYGKSAAYNGNGYSVYYTFKSPSINH